MSTLIEQTFKLPLTSLFYIVLGLVLVALAQYHWGRRRMYRLASQVQGPFNWPIIGTGLKFVGNSARIYKNVQKIFNSYPDIFKVWFGPFLIYGVSKPEYLETVLNSPKSLHKFFLYKYARQLFGHGLFTADVPLWKMHRKIIAPTFNTKFIDLSVCVFSEKSEILIKQLEKVVGQDFDLFNTINNCTLEIICETAMGYSCNAQTNSFEMAHWTDRAIEISFLRMFNLFFHYDCIFKCTPLSHELNNVISKIHQFVLRIVVEKREAFERKQALLKNNQIVDADDKRKAFLDHLLELALCGQQLTDMEVVDEVTTFIITGSDTSASSLGFFFTMLGMHPDVQQKFYEEAIDVLGPDRTVESEDLPHLKYIERAIKETLRLFPVGAFVVREMHEDLKITDEITLPAGSAVILGIMTAHRSPEHWSNPLKFDPDRFLPENLHTRHPYAYLPFLHGPRNCIGMNFGTKVMKTIAAMLVRKIRFYTDYKRVEDVQCKTNLVLRPKDGYKVRVELR